MTKNRLEAFSDGVIAIIITIMVLELHVPHEGGLDALMPLAPVFGAYVMSFLFVGVYWNNHHHLLHAAKHVTAGLMWANLHLLFWLSLTPFAAAWLGETWGHGDGWPVVLYGFIQAMCGFGAFVLARVVKAQFAHGDPMREVVEGNRVKAALSTVAFFAGMGLAFVSTLISVTLFGAVALAWLIPDRRFEEAHRKGASPPRA